MAPATAPSLSTSRPWLRTPLLAALALLPACSRRASPDPAASASARAAAPLAPAAASGSIAAAASAPPPDPLAVDPPAGPTLAIEPAVSGAVRASSAVVLGRVGGAPVAWAADEAEGQIHAFDLRTRAYLGSTRVPGAPAEMLLAPDGRLLVSLRGASQIVAFRAADAGGALVAVGRVRTAADPVAMSLTADGATLLVACRWGHRLQAFAAPDLAPRFEVPLPRDPGSIVIAPGDRVAYVSHVTGPSISRVSMEQPYNVDALSVRSTMLSLVWGGEDSHGVRDPLAPSQGSVLLAARGTLVAPQVLMANKLDPSSGPRTVSTYGGGSGDMPPALFNVVRYRLADDRRLANRDPPADVDHADPQSPEIFQDMAELRQMNRCPLPRAGVVDEASGMVLLACAGSNQVLALDATKADPARAQRESYPVPAGPVGLALDRDAVLVWSAFARTLTVQPRASKLPAVQVAVPAPGALSDEVRRGRELFHLVDPRISREARACASCHPDGREDGLVWSSPEGPRRTKMLAGRVAGSAPYGWNGEHRTLEDHVKVTFKRLGGKGLEPADLSDLVAYLVSLEGPAQPPLDDARKALVERGAVVFASPEATCAACHSPDDGFTDNAVHDVGSGPFKGMTFDTPSLRFVGGTAPYFHDGRYRTMRELLDRCDGKMGSTRHLSSDDKDALVAYLETL